ncbi:hypothetical protein AGMMS50233_10340 [Endomicrobiia bacterium]|nr:hypothetical protein AGMMS50233_10340 [Endomicrobiia bacterium]
MKLKATLSIFVAFCLALSSCDKKNAFIINRRYATLEKIEEIKEAKAKEEEKSAATPSSAVKYVLPVEPTADTSESVVPSSAVKDALPVEPTADTEHEHKPDPDMAPVVETVTEPGSEVKQDE